LDYGLEWYDKNLGLDIREHLYELRTWHWTREAGLGYSEHIVLSVTDTLFAPAFMKDDSASAVQRNA
jgi:hypothetical protein